MSGLPREDLIAVQNFGELVFDFTPRPARATGTITCTLQANYVDGENMAVIKDGFGNTYTFEADPAADGVTAGSIQVDISGDTSAADVADALATAMAGDAGFAQTFTAVDNLDGTISLTHTHPGDAMNVTITENVVNAGHTVAGMSGGKSDFFNATETFKLFTIPTGKRVRIDKVELLVDGGVTGHASNFWDFEVRKDATVMHEYSTDSADEGTLAADTLTDMTASTTDENLVANETDIVSLVLTKNASAADMSPGRIKLHARYV